MKKHLHLLFLITLVLLPSGCRTLSPAQQQTMDEAVTYLQSTAADAGHLAIDIDPANAAKVRSAVNLLDQLLVSEIYEPLKVKAALAPVIGDIKDPYVKFGIRSAINAYGVYVNRWVKGTINGNDTARQLLTALRDGGMSVLQ